MAEAVRAQGGTVVQVLFVPQRANYDCGVAALAMALGKTYEETVAIVGHDGGPRSGVPAAGVNENEVIRALFEAGQSPVMLVAKDCRTFLPEAEREARFGDFRYLFTSDELKASIRDQRALVAEARAVDWRWSL